MAGKADIPMVAPAPIEGQEEVQLITNPIWDPEVEGDWLSGVLTGIREVPIEDRVNIIYDFAEVTTGVPHIFDEGTEDEVCTSPETPMDGVAAWSSAMLERRIDKGMIGVRLTIIYDGRGKRRARIYRVYFTP